MRIILIILMVVTTLWAANTFYYPLVLKDTVTMEAETASRACYLDASKNITSSTVTATELGYVSGVTSAIQTQLNALQTDVVTTRGDTITGDASGVASRVAIGANNYVWTSDGTDAAWAAVPAGTITQLTYDITTKSADYTILDADGFTTILVDDTSADRTITLPTAADNGDRVITIKNTSTDKGKVTVDGEGAETIDGFATIDLDFKQAYITIQCNGTAWFIIWENVTSIQKSYSLTVTGTNWTTVRSVGRTYRDIEGNWFIRFNLAGNLSSTASSITLSIANVLFKNVSGFQSACTVHISDPGVDNRVSNGCYVNPNTDDVQISTYTSTFDYISSFGDLELESKPTFVE